MDWRLSPAQALAVVRFRMLFCFNHRHGGLSGPALALRPFYRVRDEAVNRVTVLRSRERSHHSRSKPQSRRIRLRPSRPAHVPASLLDAAIDCYGLWPQQRM